MHVDLRKAPWLLCRPSCIALWAAVTAACSPFKDDASGTTGLESEAGPPCDPNAMFADPTIVPGLDLTSAKARSVAGLRLSPDSLTAYFQAEGRPDGVGFHDLYTASRARPTLPFVDIAPILGVNTALEELDPTVTGDGRVLAFARAQPGSAYPVHLYHATRYPYYPFTGAQLLPNANDLSAALDETPFLREDGLVLYFASSRAPANSTDIYLAASSSEGGSVAPIPVTELNTTFSELAPVVAPNDLLIFWGSDRSDQHARGSYDVWMATRQSPSDPFSNIRNVQEINSSDLDLPTFVTSDGCALYFSSTRSGDFLPYVATKARPQ